jgi:phage-related protein
LGVAWTVETLNPVVDREVAALPLDMQARLQRLVALIEANGLPYVTAPHVKHLLGPIWELRLKGRAGIARALYVTVHAQRVVIVRVFTKKTEQTPARELDLALQRAKEIRP